jgi:L-alanine-DL-glutamate epimerase-like enolase superfamily enzyme
MVTPKLPSAIPTPVIERVEVFQVRVPRIERNRITTSYGTLPDAHHALVLIHAGGLTGVGEAPAELWWTGEDAAGVCGAVSRYLAPALVGHAVGPREAAQRMNAALASNPYAKAAVEMAVWDITAKLCRVPLYRLMGAGVALPVPVKYVIGIVDDEHAREEARWALNAGFGHLKVKVGGELKADLRRVRAVIDAAPEVRVGVDANEGWDVPTAVRAVEELDELGVSFIEQPVSRAFEDALAELTSRIRAPIVLHESLHTVQDAARCARNRAGRIWAVTPPAHGGLVNTLDILAIARTGGFPCLVGSTVELGVATAFMAHIAASDPNIASCPVPSDIIGPLYHEADIVVRQPRIEAGVVHAPETPGLGVDLDDDLVREFRVETAA